MPHSSDLKPYILSLIQKGYTCRRDIIDLTQTKFGSDAPAALISLAICQLISEYKVELHDSHLYLTDAYSRDISHRTVYPFATTSVIPSMN